jgi:LacI family transcriptional regulator
LISIELLNHLNCAPSVLGEFEMPLEPSHKREASAAHRRPTLQIIARAAGVHPSTVSRALRPDGAKFVGPKVLARIRAVAAKLGYQTGSVGAGLRTGRSSLIGVLIPDWYNPLFAAILDGLQAELAPRGYFSIVASGGPSVERQLKLAARLTAYPVEGVVLATAQLDDPVLSFLLERGVPTVLVNRAETKHRAPAVVSDAAEGMRLGVAHLIALGHTRIGHIAGPQQVSTGVQRRRGFELAMRAAGLGVDGVATAKEYSRAEGEKAAEKLLDLGVTAIIASNDVLALGAYRALAARGLSCPAEVSIVGHNDMNLMDMVHPPLTTVAIAHDYMGRQAARFLMTRIQEKDTEVVTMMTSPTLIVRSSTGPPGSARRRV